ncbi:Glycogen synthase [Ferriphaselus amnicola]|uniref:Glycogen synthase n=1 Tax=Ferriphaselus amnicola TaxID=1188319 RepID=A0A2Z6GE81_9PROT|nr:glycogen synthase GlgA [Ferriphaselus amnicola]BBE51923.1 Glycogen synthase [Ferriphaselus amnicola]
MQVLFATSEAAPLIKTGGLADVSGALPVALHKLGVDVRVLLPGYPQVLQALPPMPIVATFSSLFGFPAARLLEGTMPGGVPLWVLDCPDLYQRGGGPYADEKGQDWSDNPRRFGLLSKVAAILGSGESPLNWHPDVVHCNDWQTGLAPAFLKYAPGAARSIMSIHNIAFQGVFPAHWTPELGLPWDSYKAEGAEYYGNLSFLKAGLFFCDHITTVSPTYAREIQTDALGFGMQGLLQHKRDALTGILNGIDYDEWNPATDHHLSAHYDSRNLVGKAANKAELQRRMGLEVNPDIPLFGLVSRFTYQKGIEVFLEIAPQLIDMPAQLVLLGSGDAGIQSWAQELAYRYPGKIGVRVGFDEGLSHLIEAGSDLFMMPSRFEPCGLNQMYSQCYGTPPIVHATGGLLDSVTDCTEATLADGTATGFVIHGLSAATLLATAQHAVDIYRDPATWQALQVNGMTRDFSWSQSAEAYRNVYEKVLGY